MIKFATYKTKRHIIKNQLAVKTFCITSLEIFLVAPSSNVFLFQLGIIYQILGHRKARGLVLQ